jgi:hypothetical protein
MTTAEAIESLTDAGEFEILATRVLKFIDEDCRLLEHMGVNAAGKTIPNPIDGFCQVPGTDPPRFVMAAFTTDKVESLGRKWLFDHSAAPRAKKATAEDDGDVVKASRRAEALRKDHPNAHFVLHLCTNKQPDDQLIAKVSKRGKELGLEIRFLTRSRLRDFLDVNSDGQWLRKEHLGIQADRLSFLLLRELSSKSLQLYGQEFLITSPDAFVTTSSERTLAASLALSRSIYVVTGVSGSGKSVSCYQILRNHLAQGGVGLWIPGELAASASSLEEAISLTLRSLHPTIEPTAGAVALGLGNPSQRLVMVVDDINRGSSPAESLRKLLAWGRFLDDERNKISSPYVIIVPVWDLFWAQFDKQFRSANWLGRVAINRMEEDEALACLAATLGPRIQQFAIADRQQIVAALGYDPILIALYADSVPAHGMLHPPTVAIDVTARFVEAAEAEAATSSGTYLQSESDLALSHLAAQMLKERELYPRWQDVQRWLSTSEVQAIRELVRLGKLCRVTGRGGEDRFEFRHDRILEHFLVRALQPMLSQLESNADVLTDPFYASFVGQALALSQLPDVLIIWIQQHAPLALISSLRFLPALASEMAGHLVAAAAHWLELASKDERTPTNIRFAAYWLLKDIDTPHILDVTKSLAQHRLLARARLANGDAAAGIIEFSREFAPRVNDKDLDAVLSRTLHRHKQKLIKDCADILKKASLTESDRHGALVLAGFIGDASLATPIRVAWELAADKSNILLSALWAGLRCASSDSVNVLDEMMAVWATLPNEKEHGLSERSSIAQELQFAIRRGISEPVLNYMITKAKTDEALCWPITVTLQDLNHPLVIKFLIEQAARIERQVKETNGSSPWLMNLRQNWDPTIETTGRHLPPEAIQAIQSCWESETADPQLCETAFKCWVSAVDDLAVLRLIPDDHPQFTEVLRRRVKLGDLSTIPLIKPRLATDQYWFYNLAKIWSEQFREVLDDALLKLEEQISLDYIGSLSNAHHMLAHLLRDIPASDAQPLLTKHWGRLKFSRLFVQAALYIGSPEYVALATEAIDNSPSHVNLFEHVEYFFGFKTVGLMDRVERRHIEVLLPYLERLSDIALSDMVRFCERHSLHDVSLRNLKPEVDRRRARLTKATKEKREIIEQLGRDHLPSDDDLLEDLDRIEQQGNHDYGTPSFWLEKFERRQDDHDRLQRIFNEWFSRNPTIERFRLFAEALLEYGTRSDIDLLYKHVISGDSDEIERLRANAKFGIMRRSLR